MTSIGHTAEVNRNDLASVEQRLLEIEARQKRLELFDHNCSDFRTRAYAWQTTEQIDAMCSKYTQIIEFVSGLTPAELASFETFLQLTMDHKDAHSAVSVAGAIYHDIRVNNKCDFKNGNELRVNLIEPYRAMLQERSALQKEHELLCRRKTTLRNREIAKLARRAEAEGTPA